MKHFIGTYTNNESESKGIYSFRFEDSVFFDLKLEAIVQNPSYLAFSPDKKFLYAVSENSKTSQITEFSLDDDKLIKTREFRVNGGLLCHISVSNNGKFIYGACYESGHVICINLEKNEIFQVNQNEFRRNNTNISHAHCIIDDNYIFSTDLGLDTIFIYENKDGKLEKICERNLEKNSGARHIIKSPVHSQIYYVVTEYSREIITLNASAENFEIISVDKIYSDFSSSKKSAAAAIKISTNCTKLAATNRIFDENGEIAIFDIQSDGTLKNRKIFSTFGVHPRDFIFLSCHNFAIIANQHSSNIVCINVENGEKISEISVPSPAMIL